MCLGDGEGRSDPSLSLRLLETFGRQLQTFSPTDISPTGYTGYIQNKIKIFIFRLDYLKKVRRQKQDQWSEALSLSQIVLK